MAENYRVINAAQALEDENSVFYHYQKLIDLRKRVELVTYGDYQLLLEEDPTIFAYLRNGHQEKLLVVNNFYDKEALFTLPGELKGDEWKATILLSNYPDSVQTIQSIALRPYESIVFMLTQK